MQLKMVHTLFQLIFVYVDTSYFHSFVDEQFSNNGMLSSICKFQSVKQSMHASCHIFDSSVCGEGY